MMRTIIHIIILLNSFNGVAQSKDGMQIMEKVKQKMQLVKDYEADASIKIDISFLKIPIKNAHLYYKAPDKINFKSNGFTMLPKKGVQNMQQDLLNGKYTAIYVGTEALNGRVHDVIKVLPVSTESETVLSTLWIDETYLIKKVESTTKTQGSYLVNFIYADLPFDMPQKMTVEFDVKKMDVPVGFTMDFEQLNKKNIKEKESKGRVTITYSNYKINKGLSDDVFKKK